jgi:hypothetical protein
MAWNTLYQRNAVLMVPKPMKLELIEILIKIREY